MINEIKLGPITLHMYGLMIALGYMSALFICTYRGKKRGFDPNRITNIFYFAILGGLVGCKLLFYIVELPHIIKDPSILWNFKNGYVVYGGIIGGILFNLAYFKLKKLDNFLGYFDLIIPSVSFAQGLGRIGCLCAGCCYGRETSAWYGIVFSHSDFAPNGVKLIPTQLISSLSNFLIFGLLILFASKNEVKGRVASSYLILYGIGRALVEFLRNDYRGCVGFLSTSQLISIFIILIGILLFAVAPKLEAKKTSKLPNETYIKK